jgi:hypothetical protein
VETLLRQAGFAPRAAEEVGPTAFELGPLPAGGLEAVAFAEERGLSLGVRVPLAPPCEIAGLAPTAERALKLLGAMMLGLQAQGMQVSAVARYRGLEALLLTVHLCPPLRGAERVRAGFEALRRTAQALSRALAEPPDRVLVAVRHAAGVQGLLAVSAPRHSPVAVPSFDPDVSVLRRRRSRARRGSGA